MKKHIKNKIIDELMKSLKKSEKINFSIVNKNLKEIFNLLDQLPSKRLNEYTIVPIGRLIDTRFNYDLPDLNYFYFLVLKEKKVNLHMCDLKEIDKISKIIINPAFHEEKKYDKLVDWVSELQNHPDFLFEDLESMEEKISFSSQNKSLC